jgi:hypothetical protein
MLLRFAILPASAYILFIIGNGQGASVAERGLCSRLNKERERYMLQSVSLEAREIVNTEANRLEALGQLLYGEHWIAPMARDLQVCRDTMTNWASGKRELAPDHSIFAALPVLVHFHEKAIAKARRIMERNRI